MVYTIFLVLFVVPVPALLLTGFNFGHTSAVDEQVDELDKTVREQRQSDTTSNDFGGDDGGGEDGGSNDGGTDDGGTDDGGTDDGGGDGGGDEGCAVDYPNWLENVKDREDLRQELLEPDTNQITPSSSPSSLAVKGNPDFWEEDDGGDVTADTILKRCNMHFRDKNDNDLQHWVYCRAMQLPSGDTFTDLEALRDDPDSSPADLYTAAFFHGSNVDDPSENWMVPLINKYQEGCHDRTLNIIWVGVWVRDLSVDPPDYKLSLGNRWHVTASAWENTVLFDVMEPSQLNFSGHSTASCPFDSTDTHGLWVGGTAEDEGRRITGKFTDQQSLWVGDNSSNQAACYSGVADGNPVNANDYGVQFEYQVLLPDGSDTEVDPGPIADSVLDEF